MWTLPARQRALASPATAQVRVRSRGPAFGLLLTLTTLLLLLVARPACAALVFAPMCGTHAQSVVAPPISRAAPEIPLAPSDCQNEQRTRFETGHHEQGPLPSPVVELTPRLPALAYRLPPAPRVLVPRESSRCGERAAHGAALERPPRG